mmetsp:Transcript_8962/g.14884  ORF Transcript_8962/g.14884 Transcript_8962/m.14884 type:complete len:393 (-) Transcript_8962:263-1441(-)
MENYQPLGKIGEGTYGRVFKARHRDKRTIFAVKRLRIEGEDEGIHPTAVREISFLKALNHPNIVRLYDVVFGERRISMVLEYLDYDLKQFMEARKGMPLDVECVQCFYHQLLSGLEYCHANRIIHRDLKPQNILVSKRGDVKLADFGLARAQCNPISNFSADVVTLWYRPPEALLGATHYSTSLDMWSVGCIFAEMVRGRPLFPGQTEEMQLGLLFRCLGTPNEAIYPGVTQLPHWKDKFRRFQAPTLQQFWQYFVPSLDSAGVNLLTSMVVYDPKKRITAKQALAHPYFNNIKENRCKERMSAAADAAEAAEAAEDAAVKAADAAVKAAKAVKAATVKAAETINKTSAATAEADTKTSTVAPGTGAATQIVAEAAEGATQSSATAEAATTN